MELGRFHSLRTTPYRKTVIFGDTRQHQPFYASGPLIDGLAVVCKCVAACSIAKNRT